MGVPEAVIFQHEEIKSNVQVTATYKWQLRLILQSRLSGHNQILAISGIAVPVIRYTAGVINWTISKPLGLDRLINKETDDKALHPHSDIDRSYVEMLGEDSSLLLMLLGLRKLIIFHLCTARPGPNIE